MAETTNTVIMIPARYASSRYHGKPLVHLDGVPMVRRVYDTCIKSGIDTFVLTDDCRIAEQIPHENVYYDNTEYANGTERCAGASKNHRFNDYSDVINVQGDMPDISVNIIYTICSVLENHNLATVYTDLADKDKNNPSAVKMIHSIPNTSSMSKTLWFGRGVTGYGSHHLGVYGYKKSILTRYTQMQETDEERLEKLEQLRWLKHGIDLFASYVTFDGIEINTPEDAVLWHKKNSH